jgi:predicted RNase H-like HicB family nuclease
MVQRRYTVILEVGSEGVGAYVPDIPGVSVVGDSPADAYRLIEEAVAFYFEDHTGAVPESASLAATIVVEVPDAGGNVASR